MTNKLRSLDRMTVPTPCDVDWDSMIGNERVRFCEHCNLHVTNLSELTHQQAMRLVSESNGRLCVRFVRRRDRSVGSKQLPQKLHHIGRRVSRIAAGAFTATLSLSSAAAQQPKASQSRVESLATPAQVDLDSTLTGVVSDPNGAVVLQASVNLNNLKDGSSFTYTTAEDGMYKFSLLPAGTYRLSVYASGFVPSNTDEIELIKGAERTLNLELQLPEIIEEVTITASAEVREVRGGGAVAFIEPENPLIRAVLHDDLDAVRDLVFAASDLNVRDKSANVTALEQAIENGNLEIVRTLLTAGATVNTKNGNDATPLMYLRENATAALVRELVAAGAKINARDESGGTALMAAAYASKYEVVKELVDAGADVDLADVNGKTALMSAAENNDPQVAKLLIDAGADVNAKDEQGKSGLMAAAESGDPEVVKLLISYGAEVNAVDKNGWSAMMYIVETTDLQSALALLNAGADLSLRSNDGKTLLAVARESPHDEMIKLLQSRGAPE